MKALSQLCAENRPSQMSYHLLGKNKKPKGPYSLSQLRDLWQADKIPAGTLCCKKGGKKWLPIKDVEAITSHPIEDGATGKSSSESPPSTHIPIKPVIACVAALLVAGIGYLILSKGKDAPGNKAGLIIITQPRDQGVTAANEATFSVSVEGHGLKYQWKKDGNEINNATSPTYTIHNARQSDEGNYTCLVSGKAGKLTSDSAILMIITEKELDQFGNLEGNQYDLCKDGAHEGKTIVVLQFHGGESKFREPIKALEEKGFNVIRHTTPPLPEDLRLELEKACQIWIISGGTRLLNEKHIQVIKEFFDSGKGMYIWGDNVPLYADANALGKALLGVEMKGNKSGQQIVQKSPAPGKPGFIDHDITTGLNNIYEGHTIATIGEAQNIHPIMRGSAGNVVTAVYRHDGKRAVIDGGFTRLYSTMWDKTPGTARFVKNAACWLVNESPGVVISGDTGAPSPPATPFEGSNNKVLIGIGVSMGLLAMMAGIWFFFIRSKLTPEE